MRVLVLSHMYPKPDNEISGIFVHNQVIETVDKGCKIAVISPIRQMPIPLGFIDRKWQIRKTIPKSTVLDGVQIYHPPYMLFPRAMFYWTSGQLLYRGIRTMVERLHLEMPFDLIHAHTALPDGYAAIMLKKKYRLPVVVTIHGADLQSTIHRNNKCKNAVGKVFKEADHIITVSNKLKRIAAANYGCENIITTIPNGIYPYVYKSKRDSVQQIMLSVSNLIRSKGIDLNLQAFAALMDRYPALVYKIIGNGPDLPRLKKIIKELGIPQNRVYFMGQLSNQEVIRHMSESDIFSLPSWSEGFGVVYLEAMSQGRPVIACKGEGIEDVIKHRENGFLVEARSVDDLVCTIDYLLNNSQQAAIVGESAQRTVLESYTWEKNAEKTIGVYRQVLGV